MTCCDAHGWRIAWTLAVLAALTGCGGSVGTGAGAHPDGGTTFDATTADAMDSGALSDGDSGDDAIAEDASGDRSFDAMTADAADSGPPSDSGSGDGTADACIPKTCQQVGYTCGANDDGCGGTVTCLCRPLTCQQLGTNCGLVADGCGGLVDCGTCAPPQTCGGGGFNRCGHLDGGTCYPANCAQQGITCRPAGDGCGGTNNAGCGYPCDCKDPGSSGTIPGCLPSIRACDCTPLTCADLGYDCGSYGDGCGGTISCGTCTAPQFCGGGGFDKCGGSGPAPDSGPIETPATCQSLGYTCGTTGDGLGGLLDCGTCTPPQFCGGGGSYKCGGTGLPRDGSINCIPATCAWLGFNCGKNGDGCGGVLNCGTCTGPGEVCGGGGFNLCGVPGDAQADAGAGG